MDKKTLHKKFFNREIQMTPALVNVLPGGKGYTYFEARRDPQKAIDNAVARFSKTMEINEFLMPTMESNFMETLIPSIFGAKVYESPGGYVDVKPIFESIYDTEKINVDDIFNAEMEEATKHLEYLYKNAPDYIYVNPTRPLSPLDSAAIMCGGEIYAALLEEPELSLEFLNKITDVTIKTIKHFKKVINQPLDECANQRGLLYPGLRLTGDAVVNLSPDMIVDIMCPIYKRFQKEFGKIMLHYCTTPAPSQHVIPALIRGGGIDAVDNWQGYESIINKEDYFQTELGMCTDLKKAYIFGDEIKNDEFLAFKGRPLVLSAWADDIEQGKRIFDILGNLFG